jgi:hypothetical protein
MNLNTTLKKSFCLSAAILILLLVGYLPALYAQIPLEPKVAQSPNAASLGLFGDVPVSQFSGLPSIEVPLYTLQEGKLNLPISLAYHASGVRPDMHPGWVGMGWALQAGGAITRSVNDQPDELNRPNSGCPQCGMYFFPAWLNNANWDQKPFLQTIASSKYSNITYNQINNNHQDSEPDEFNFNVPGYSGKFYLDMDGTYKVQCDKPVKVTLNTAQPLLPVPFSPPSGIIIEGGYFSSFSGFTITVEDGTQYIFGGTTNAIEYNLGFFRQDKDSWVATAWYLTSVVHQEGPSLSLTYTRDQGKFTNQMYLSIYEDTFQQLSDNSNLVSSCSSYTNGVYNIYQWFNGKLIAPVYLSTISSSNVVLQFDRSATRELRYPQYAYDYMWSMFNTMYGTFLPYLSPYGNNYPAGLLNLEWQKLDRIRITDKYNRSISTFSLGYSDNPNNSNRDAERLTLLSVTELGRNNIAKPAYQFAYQNYQGLPGYLALQSDHWGFFNNCARYANMNPYLAQVFYQSHYADREPSTDPAVYLRGMLTRMTYPTGGISAFDYSQNTYSQQLAVVRSGLQAPAPAARQATGGVRIRRITSWSPDNTAEKTQKTYYYINSTSLADTATAASSGVLGGQSRYYYDDYRVPAYNAPSRWLYTKHVFSTQSVLPGCSNSNGSHIGYSQVVEKNADGGYKVYNFTNFDNGRLDEVATDQNILQTSRIPYEPYSSNEEQRGKLYKERYYNNAGQLVKLHETDYSKVAEGFVRSIKAAAYTACVQVADARIGEGMAYKFYTYSYLPSQDRETTYDAQGLNPATVTKTYGHTGANPRLLATESQQDSKGSTLLTKYKYPPDFTYSGATSSSAQVQALAQMPAKNIIGSPVEIVQYRDGNVIGATFNYFKPNGTSIVPSAVSALETTQPLPVGQPTQYVEAGFDNSGGAASPSPLRVDSRLKPKVTYLGYDAKGNILGLQKESNSAVSYLWGYNATYPIAKVENAVPNEVFHSNFEDRTGWDSYINYDGGPYRSSWLNGTTVRTGQIAGYVNNYSQGYPVHSFSTTPLTIASTATKKFVYSGWVYSEGPTAQIWLFMYRAGETGYYSYVDYVETAVANKWVYLEKTFEVPADVVSLNIRLTNFYRGVNPRGGNVWFDDIRLHPANAQMSTYTLTPGVGVTSISDANNKPIIYEYDGLNRLSIMRDKDGNIVKQFDYHYQR